MVIKAFGAFLLVLNLSGCIERGIIYSNTVEPYSQEFNATRIGTKTCILNSYKIVDPLTGYSISAEWTTSVILDRARKAGIRDINFIDKKTLSILNGLYRRESLIIYGD